MAYRHVIMPISQQGRIATYSSYPIRKITNSRCIFATHLRCAVAPRDRRFALMFPKSLVAALIFRATSLNKTLKTILADTPLVRNLENEDYLNIILNGCSTMAERFSQIDDKIAREHLKEAGKNQERIPPEAKLIIKQPDLPEKISALFLGESKKSANCHLPI